MSEEEPDQKSHLATNYVNSKIVVSAILSVLLGIVALLAIVNFGMNVQRKFDSEAQLQKEKEHVESIIAVDYKADAFAYAIPEGSDSLLSKLEAGENEKSYTIISKDELNKVLEAITGFGGVAPVYQIEGSYFNSSSVVAVPLEEVGLTNLAVKSVTRDENYNIQIDLSAKKDNTKTEKSGRVVFVRLSNIQPAQVTINID